MEERRLEKLKELEQAVSLVKQTGSKEHMEQMMGLLQQSDVFVPATFPKDTDPKLLRQLAEKKGNQPIPQGVVPQPSILENKDGQKFLPVFTSQEQVEKGSQRPPMILGMPFKAACDLLAKERGLQGIVINAFDQNLVLNATVNVEKEPQQDVQITAEQFHAFMRQQVEANLFPQAVLEQKKEYIEDLRKRQGAVLAELYQPLYEGDNACPYDADDFDVMPLNIREDLTIFRIMMPSQGLVAGTCPAVLIAWNPQEELARYFGIVMGKNGDAHIMEAKADGTKQDLGDAPAEGSELQYLIDLIDA